MTRDQAKKIAEVHCGDRVDASQFVEIAVALGMLKLDEPKSAEEKFFDQWAGCKEVSFTREQFSRMLASANLLLTGK